MTNYTNDKLSDTNTNLTLGSNYKYGSRGSRWLLGFGLAAYNAGPSRSKAWRENYQAQPKALFCRNHSIHGNTRVKNVLSMQLLFICNEWPNTIFKATVGVIAPKVQLNLSFLKQLIAPPGKESLI
jgi:soluble lytic murein transglycosylase